MERFSCPSCLGIIKETVQRMNGTDSKTVDVDYLSSQVKVEYDANFLSIERIEKAIETTGYKVIQSDVNDA